MKSFFTFLFQDGACRQVYRQVNMQIYLYGRLYRWPYTSRIPLRFTASATEKCPSSSQEEKQEKEETVAVLQYYTERNIKDIERRERGGSALFYSDALRKWIAQKREEKKKRQQRGGSHSPERKKRNEVLVIHHLEIPRPLAFTSARRE